jgi:hypothetical protein
MLISASRFLLVVVVVSSGVKVEGLVGMDRTSADAMTRALANTSWGKGELCVRDNKVRNG